MNDRQSEKSLDRSTLTECNPCKLTFDVAPGDVKEARAMGEQGKSNHAINDLPKVEIVDTENGGNPRSLGQPRDICKNPDAGDWSPAKCDSSTKELNAAPSEKSLAQPADNRNGDVKDICHNPDTGDWAPAKCGTAPKQPRDMSQEELLSLPADAQFKYKEDQFKEQHYRQKRMESKEDLREYERGNRVGEYGPDAKTFFTSNSPSK